MSERDRGRNDKIQKQKGKYWTPLISIGWADIHTFKKIARSANIHTCICDTLDREKHILSAHKHNLRCNRSTDYFGLFSLCLCVRLCVCIECVLLIFWFVWRRRQIFSPRRLLFSHLALTHSALSYTLGKQTFTLCVYFYEIIWLLLFLRWMFTKCMRKYDLFFLLFRSNRWFKYWFADRNLIQNINRININFHRKSSNYNVI